MSPGLKRHQCCEFHGGLKSWHMGGCGSGVVSVRDSVRFRFRVRVSVLFRIKISSQEVLGPEPTAVQLFP